MIKVILLLKKIPLFLIFFSSSFSLAQGLIIDHTCTNLNIIPAEWINSAKANLHIAYQHTSHGSQLISGMNGLEDWKGDLFAFNNGGTNGALDLHDYAMSGLGASDLGNPNRTNWAQATADYLNNSNNSDVNVIIWSWCGQVSSADSADIQTYLDLMSSLEDDFPDVKFVYMTGHLDGTGVNGNLHKRNEQIRRYCRNNNKILYDFADTESYDPDGNYYLDKAANDNCDYDSDGNGSRDKNWAQEWQNNHTENVDWYSCSAAHSQALNGNRKAYAAWWLWASLSGWNGSTIADNEKNTATFVNKFSLEQNYPNPFNPTTKIKYTIPISFAASPFTKGGLQGVTLKIYDLLGNEVATLVNEQKSPGTYEVDFNAEGLPSGIYFYRLEAESIVQTKKMTVLR